MPLSPDRLAADLRALGVVPGDVLMVHASLRRIGPVEGGADGVVAALDAVVGPSGTVLMTLGARDDTAWINQRPEPERAGLLDRAEPFDARTTPADPEVGVLAEVFRTRDGTVVSDHPEGRFGARGRHASELVDDVPWDDYYGPGSPLERLVRLGGRVVRLGADVDTVTLLHYAEHLAPIPAKRRVRRHRAVRRGDRVEHVVVESLDDSTGIADYDGPDYFGVLLGEYLAARPARPGLSVGLVGAARSELIDAADLTRFAVEWMVRNLGGS